MNAKINATYTHEFGEQLPCVLLNGDSNDKKAHIELEGETGHCSWNLIEIENSDDRWED